MTKDRGPYAERPDDYHGIPEVVRLDYKDGVPVKVATAAPDSVVPDWSLEGSGDTLLLGWPRARVIWGLIFEIAPDGSGYNGQTWYWSHEPGVETVKVPTEWRSVACP